jgi:anti-sigma B factor antagonist
VAALDRVRETGLLTIRVEREDDALIVHASGELDIASAKEFEGELRRAISSSVSGVVLDLRGVNFIDSSGLRALLAGAGFSSKIGRQLRIPHGSSAVQRAIELSGLEGSLPLVE